jgi:hypothetical protein
MLAQVFNPTEIKKNGPATRPASAPARRRASPFTAVSAVLPTTAPKLRRCPRQRQRMIVGRGWSLGSAPRGEAKANADQNCRDAADTTPGSFSHGFASETPE